MGRLVGRLGLILIGAAMAGAPLLGGSSAVAQTRDGGPQLRVAPRILVEIDFETPLMIHVGPAEAVPSRSYIQLRGLPEAAVLNEGHNVAPGVWAVPMRALTNLTIQAPQAAAGTADFTIRLLGVEGAVLSEARATLIVAPGFQMSRSAGKEQAQREAGSPAPAADAKAPPPASERMAASPPAAATAPPAARRAAEPPPAPARAAPPEPPRIVLSPDERARLERLVGLGNRHLGNGNIAAAREFFRRAADGGLAEGALLLATTYDPAELSAIKVQGLTPDLAEARRWYERARELGASGVDARLARLR